MRTCAELLSAPSSEAKAQAVAGLLELLAGVYARERDEVEDE